MWLETGRFMNGEEVGARIWGINLDTSLYYPHLVSHWGTYMLDQAYRTLSAQRSADHSKQGMGSGG